MRRKWTKHAFTDFINENTQATKPVLSDEEESKDATPKSSAQVGIEHEAAKVGEADEIPEVIEIEEEEKDQQIEINSAEAASESQIEEPEHSHDDGMDELCAICYTSELREEPCVKLSCGHIFHENCVLQLLQHRWNTLKISFAFMACPTCKQEITETNNAEINKELASLNELRQNIESQALKVASNQGLDHSERLTAEGDPYKGDLLGLAMHTCAFYECYDCNKPYFGGMVDCQQQLGLEENTKKEDLRCKDCQLKAYGAGQGECKIHGKAHIDWKCSYCCNIAMWHCFGTTYMCDRCHRTDPYGGKLYDCGGVNCPLGMPHPPAHKDPKKSTFPLGCGLCRSERLSKMRENKNIIQEVDFDAVEKQQL